MPKFTGIAIKATIVLVLVILTVSAISYSVSQKSPAGAPGQESPTDAKTSSPEQQNLPANTAKPEPPKVRYVSGVIKEVKKNSIIVTDTATGKDTEVGFDSSTKILKGEGTGETATASNLADGWNVAVFLPESKDNNVAQIIHLVTKLQK